MPEAKLDTSVIGSSGLKKDAGVINEEFHPKLKGEFGPKLYREMSDNSSVIGSIAFVIEALVRQVEWRVEPADATSEALEQAEFVESCLIDMDVTFEDFMSEVLSFLPYGWSYFEKVFKLRKGPNDDKTINSRFEDGKIGWRNLALRAQDTLERWEFDTDDELLGMKQTHGDGEAVLVPIDKSILFRTKITKNNPEGRSIYRNAVVDYFFLKRIGEIEAIGIERDMTGLITMQVPIALLHPDASGKTKALRAAFETMLSELKRDQREFAMVPSEIDTNGKPTGYKLELLHSGGRRQIDTTAVKLSYKINILQSVLAQFIQLGMANVGSFALASSQTNLFAIAIGAILDSIAATFNRFGINDLMMLNGIRQDIWPELVHGDLETISLTEMGSYVTSLAGAGMLPAGDEALQRKFLEIAKLPMPAESDAEGEEVGAEEVEEEVAKSKGGLRLKYHNKRVCGCR